MVAVVVVVFVVVVVIGSSGPVLHFSLLFKINQTYNTKCETTNKERPNVLSQMATDIELQMGKMEQGESG